MATTQDADDKDLDDESIEVMQQVLDAHDSIDPSHQLTIDDPSDLQTAHQPSPSTYIMAILCSIGAIIGLILAKL